MVRRSDGRIQARRGDRRAAPDGGKRSVLGLPAARRGRGGGFPRAARGSGARRAPRARPPVSDRGPEPMGVGGSRSPAGTAAPLAGGARAAAGSWRPVASGAGIGGELGEWQPQRGLSHERSGAFYSGVAGAVPAELVSVRETIRQVEPGTGRVGGVDLLWAPRHRAGATRDEYLAARDLGYGAVRA